MSDDGRADVLHLLPRQSAPEGTRLFLNIYRNNKTGNHYPGLTFYPTHQRAIANIVNEDHFVATVQIVLSDEGGR